MKGKLILAAIGVAALAGCSSTTELTRAEPNEVPKWFVQTPPNSDDMLCANGSYTTNTVEDAETGAKARADGALSTDLAGLTSRTVDQRSISRSRSGPGTVSQQVKVRTLIESSDVALRPWTEQQELFAGNGSMVTAYVQRCQLKNELVLSNEFDDQDAEALDSL